MCWSRTESQTVVPCSRRLALPSTSRVRTRRRTPALRRRGGSRVRRRRTLHRRSLRRARTRRFVLALDGGCVIDGCASRHRLQPHHIIPRAMGGDHHPDNLATTVSVSSSRRDPQTRGRTRPVLATSPTPPVPQTRTRNRPTRNLTHPASRFRTHPGPAGADPRPRPSARRDSPCVAFVGAAIRPPLYQTPVNPYATAVETAAPITGRATAPARRWLRPHPCGR